MKDTEYLESVDGREWARLQAQEKSDAALLAKLLNERAVLTRTIEDLRIESARANRERDELIMQRDAARELLTAVQADEVTMRHHAVANLDVAEFAKDTAAQWRLKACEARADVERLKAEVKERQKQLEAALEERASAFAERNWANERHDEVTERLQALDVGCSNCGGLPHTIDCRERPEALKAEVERLRAALRCPGESYDHVHRCGRCDREVAP
jgi:chromosome segregation ATPase